MKILHFTNPSSILYMFTQRPISPQTLLRKSVQQELLGGTVPKADLEAIFLT